MAGFDTFSTSLMGGATGSDTPIPGPYDAAGDVFGALGKSLMTSPGNDPLRGFGGAIQGVNNAQTASEKTRQLIQTLRGKGLTDQQIQAAISNPSLLSGLSGSLTSDTDVMAMPTGGLSANPSPGPIVSPGNLMSFGNLFGGL